jgi:malonyl-CoA O-methyltransferase
MGLDTTTLAILANNFGKAAPYYHHHAQVQEYAAHRLLQQLLHPLARESAPKTMYRPQGHVLEFGCGTGFLTEGLVQIFPQHSLHITDLSPEMLRFCRDHLIVPCGTAVEFSVLDVNQLACDPLRKPRYNLIISNFVLQWCDDPAQLLQGLYQWLLPGGALVVSFPSDHSFPELKAYCDQCGIAYPLNPLPSFNTIAQTLYEAGLNCDFVLEWFSESYDTMRQALGHLKNLGAGLSTTHQGLSYREVRQFLKGESSAPPEGIKMSYQIVFLTIKKSLAGDASRD